MEITIHNSGEWRKVTLKGLEKGAFLPSSMVLLFLATVRSFVQAKRVLSSGPYLVRGRRQEAHLGDYENDVSCL